MISRMCIIRFPGTIVDGERNRGRIITSHLNDMATALADAAISLSWFEKAIERTASEELEKEQWERKRRLRVSLMLSLGSAAFDDVLDREERILRLAVASGEIPTTYENRVAFIHARTFLFALDSIKRSLDSLQRMQGAPVELDAARTDLKANFPTLVNVRDSAHHAEERAAGLAHGKPIDIKPVNGFLGGGAAFLIREVLNGDAYGGTSANGEYEEVHVNSESLTVMQSLVQRSVDAFSWMGPPRVQPTL